MEFDPDTPKEQSVKDMTDEELRICSTAAVLFSFGVSFDDEEYAAMMARGQEIHDELARRKGNR